MLPSWNNHKQILYNAAVTVSCF